MSTNQDPEKVTHLLDLTRAELYERVWRLSLSTVAGELECSPARLRDVCVEAQVPIPNAAYWRQKRSGKVARRSRLPKGLEPNTKLRDCCPVSARQRPSAAEPEARSLDDLDADIRGALASVATMQPFELAAPDSRRRLLPEIAATRRVARKSAKDEWPTRFNRIRRQAAFPEPAFLVEVGTGSVGRIAQLLQTIAKTVIGLGGELATDRTQRVGIRLLDELHTLRIRERLKRHLLDPAAGEKDERSCVWRATGILELHLESRGSGESIRKWIDGPKGTLEEQLGDFFASSMASSTNFRARARSARASNKSESASSATGRSVDEQRSRRNGPSTEGPRSSGSRSSMTPS